MLLSLVHYPRNAAEKASCCCEAGSLAISKAWPTVIWSFRNASATDGMRSARRMRPYYVGSLFMWPPSRKTRSREESLHPGDHIS